jgi:hypothetical protein
MSIIHAMVAKKFTTWILPVNVRKYPKFSPGFDDYWSHWDPSLDRALEQLTKAVQPD